LHFSLWQNCEHQIPVFFICSRLQFTRILFVRKGSLPVRGERETPSESFVIPYRYSVEAGFASQGGSEELLNLSLKGAKKNNRTHTTPEWNRRGIMPTSIGLGSWTTMTLFRVRVQTFQQKSNSFLKCSDDGKKRKKFDPAPLTAPAAETKSRRALAAG